MPKLSGEENWFLNIRAIFALLIKSQDHEKDVALGIDIGGTNTAFGFIDREGNYLTEGNIPTAKHEDINDYLKELYLEIEKVLDPIRQEVNFVGIGIGAPNGNYFKGAIEFAPNLPWHDVIPLCDMMKEYYPELPVYLNNDAKAAAIGEMIYGGAQGMKNFIMITLGTGLGSGFVVNGELVYGHDGFAGELGHTMFLPTAANVVADVAVVWRPMYLPRE